MPVPTTEQLEAIDQKIDKGEELTPEEKSLVDGDGSQQEEEQVDPENKNLGIKKEKQKEDSEEANEKAAETPAEKDAKAAEAKKKEADDAAAKEAERKNAIEKEAEKPIDEANIENYSQTERALFFELRKERRKRQEAQRESDTLKFQRQKAERERQLQREREEAEAKAKAEVDPFEGREDDDLLTVADVKKLFTKGKKETPKGKEEPSVEEVRAERLQRENWLLKAQQKAPDLLTVLTYADTLLIDDDNARAEVEDVVAKGGNPILATYKLLKSHPKWAEIEAKLKTTSAKNDDKGDKKDEANLSEDEKKERAERIEKNNKKVVTTGTGGGGSATPGEYTLQEVLNMSEEEFGNLPKSQRDRILEGL